MSTQTRGEVAAIDGKTARQPHHKSAGTEWSCTRAIRGCRIGHAPESLALVRKITHNLLQQEQTLKRGVKTKRLKTALDEAYLLKVLNSSLAIAEIIMRLPWYFP